MKDTRHTTALISKRALEIAEHELIALKDWAYDEGATSADILDRIDTQLEIYKDLIEESFYSLEQLRRDSDNHSHQIVTKRGVHIADHAVVRHLQRIIGVDMKELANEIVPEDAGKIIKGLRNGRVINGKSVIVFKNGVVVTILAKDKARRYRMKLVDVRKKQKRKTTYKRTKRRIK